MSCDETREQTRKFRAARINRLFENDAVIEPNCPRDSGLPWLHPCYDCQVRIKGSTLITEFCLVADRGVRQRILVIEEDRVVCGFWRDEVEEFLSETAQRQLDIFSRLSGLCERYR